LARHPVQWPGATTRGWMRFSRSCTVCAIRGSIRLPLRSQDSKYGVTSSVGCEFMAAFGTFCSIERDAVLVSAIDASASISRLAIGHGKASRSPPGPSVRKTEVTNAVGATLDRDSEASQGTCVRKFVGVREQAAPYSA